MMGCLLWCVQKQRATLFSFKTFAIASPAHTHVIAQPIGNRECLNVLPRWKILLLLNAKAVLKAMDTAKSPMKFENNPIGPCYGGGVGWDSLRDWA